MNAQSNRLADHLLGGSSVGPFFRVRGLEEKRAHRKIETTRKEHSAKERKNSPRD